MDDLHTNERQQQLSRSQPLMTMRTFLRIMRTIRYNVATFALGAGALILAWALGGAIHHIIHNLF